MSSDKSCKSLSDKYAPVKIRSLVWIACGFWLYTEQGWRFLFDYSAAEDTTEELWNWNSEIKTKAAWWWRNRLYHVGFWRNILRYEKIQEFPPDNLSGPFWKIEIIQEHLRWFWRSAVHQTTKTGPALFDTFIKTNCYQSHHVSQSHYITLNYVMSDFFYRLVTEN